MQIYEFAIDIGFPKGAWMLIDHRRGTCTSSYFLCNGRGKCIYTFQIVNVRELHVNYDMWRECSRQPCIYIQEEEEEEDLTRC